MQIDKRRAALQYQNKVNNAQGHFFEGANNKSRCALSLFGRERADVDKTPEPFRVIEKGRDGIFKGAVHSPLPSRTFKEPLRAASIVFAKQKYTTTDAWNGTF